MNWNSLKYDLSSIRTPIHVMAVAFGLSMTPASAVSWTETTGVHGEGGGTGLAVLGFMGWRRKRESA